MREICASFLAEPGSMFPCHKTVNTDELADDGDWTELPKWQMCAGGLILAEKVRPNKPVRMLQLGERMGLYDKTKLTGFDDVVDSQAEMLKLALPGRTR